MMKWSNIKEYLEGLDTLLIVLIPFLLLGIFIHREIGIGRFTLSALLVWGCFAIAVVVLGLLIALYKWFRLKTNKPRIGLEYFLCKLLDRDDYVSINGKVMCYSHKDEDNIAFYNKHRLEYILYDSSLLRECDFIYGEYGVKWAASIHDNETARQKVEEAKSK